MGTLISLAVESAPSMKPWLPAWERGAKLKASGVALTHEYQTETLTLSSPDSLYLQVSFRAWQIHPMKWNDLDQFGPIDGIEMQRWTWEGPTSIMPGELPNCSIRCEVTHSVGSSPGSDWKVHQPGERYYLRSCKARIVIARPSTAYNFRVAELRIRGTREPEVIPSIHAARFYSHG